MDGTPTTTMCNRVLDLIESPAFTSCTNSPLYANPRGAETQVAIEQASVDAFAFIGSQAQR